MDTITARDILDCYSRSETLDLALRAWRAGNDAGEGFAYRWGPAIT